MDESHARFAHVRAKQQRDLEAAVYRDWDQHARFWRVQSASIRYLFSLVFADRGIFNRRTKVRGESASAQASRECAVGRDAANEPEIH